MKKKVMIAMSGGVDSSACAALLVENGYECIGTTMKLYNGDSDDVCGSDRDIKDAQAVAQKLGMDFLVQNYEKEFKDNVICDFIKSYEVGITPNPCIVCNRTMKFGRLHQYAKEIGADYVATGHYARVEYDEERGKYLLKKGLDSTKDQSYVLYSLTQEQLSRTLFPLGEFSKEEIRKYAEGKGFVNAHKKDSQDICFVPDGDYASFIEKETGFTYPVGNFVDRKGNVYGTHKGMIHYTIGQRKGLGLSLKEPMYVVEKRMDTCEVVLGRNEDLFADELTARNFNWTFFGKEDVEKLANEPLKVTAKTRYSQKEQAAWVSPLEDGRVKVSFEQPVRAITSGQSVVIYDNDIVIGGGIIE